MTPLTHTELFSVYVRGDDVVAPHEPLTSENEASGYLHAILDDPKLHVDSVTVLRATERGVSDWTADLVSRMADGTYYHGKADAPACLHPFIEDPAYDHAEAEAQKFDDTRPDVAAE